MRVKIPTALVQRESAKASSHAEDFGCTNRASALVMIEEFKNIAKSRHSGFLPFVLPKSHILELVTNIPRLNIDQSFRQPSPSSSTSTPPSLSSSTSSVETSTQNTTTTPGGESTGTGTGTAKFFTRLHDTENEDHFEPYFYGSSTSTYPTMNDKDTREGEPICDQYRALLRSDYSVLALADGCNWGIGPAKAAHIAVKTFVQHIDQHRGDVFDTNKLASLCVSAVLEAHNKIIRNKCNLKRVGTTTLIGGVVCKLSPLIVGRSIAEVLPSLFHFSPSPHDPPSPGLSSSTSSSPPGLSLNLSATLSLSSTASPVQSPSTSSPSLSTSVPSSTTGIQSLWKSLTNLHQKVQGHDSHSPSSSSSSSSSTTANDSSSNVTTEENAAGETGAGVDQGNTPMSPREEVAEDDMMIIKPWAFVFASIGDCKAFLWSRKTSTLSELTVDSRLQSSTNASDCGGRIGPFIDGAPDLSNLNVYCVFCDKDDIILLCSDGVYDNFDPQMLGFSPKDFDIPSDEWDSADSALINDLKVEYRNRFMNNLIEPLRHSPSSSSSLSSSSSSSLKAANLSAASISQTLVEQSVRTTQSSQRFMRDNPKRKLPLNYNQYPGKCDHTTIMSLQVSSIDPSLLSSSSFLSSSSSSFRSYSKSRSSSSSSSSSASSCSSTGSSEKAAKNQQKTAERGSATSSGSSSSYSSPSVSPPPPPSPLHDQVLADLEMSPSPSFTFAKTPTLPSSTLFNLDNAGTDFALNSSPTAESSIESVPLRNAWKINLEKELQTYQPIDLIPPPHLIRPFTFPLRVSNPPPLSSSSSSSSSPSSPKSSSSSSSSSNQRKLSFSGINALRVFLSDGSHRSTKVVGSTTCSDVTEVLIEKIRLFQSNDSIDIDSYRLYIKSNDLIRKVIPVKSDELIMPLIYKGDFIFLKPSEIDSPSLSWFFSESSSSSSSSPSASPSSSSSSPSSSADNSPSSSSSSLLSSSSGDKKRKKYKANSFIARISQSKRDN